MVILPKLGYITYLPHKQWGIHCWVSTIITPNIRAADSGVTCPVASRGNLPSFPPRTPWNCGALFPAKLKMPYLLQFQGVCIQYVNATTEKKVVHSRMHVLVILLKQSVDSKIYTKPIGNRTMCYKQQCFSQQNINLVLMQKIIQ